MMPEATNPDLPLRELIQKMRPALESMLDGVAILNTEKRIIFMNLAMKNFLGLSGHDLKKQPNFCELLGLEQCKAACPMDHLLKTGRPFRLDEAPGAVLENKYRISVKGVAIPGLGLIVTLRDTTAELLLQAKYHKLISMVNDKDQQITNLKDALQALNYSMRKRAS